MAIETRCQTPGARLQTDICADSIYIEIALPMTWQDGLAEADFEVLDANLHNAVELVLASLPIFRPTPEEGR